MIAITIATGDQYLRLAKAAAESCRRSTGLTTRIIDETPGEPIAARYKLQLLQLFPSETILYFDADTRFLRAWNVAALDDLPHFCAAVDMPSPAREQDCHRYSIDPTRYVNSGIWIANHRHAKAFALANQLARAVDYTTAFRYEQTALNVALQRLSVPIAYLDRRYNVLCDPASDVPPNPVVIHRAGGGRGGDHDRIFERLIQHANLSP